MGHTTITRRLISTGGVRQILRSRRRQRCLAHTFPTLPVVAKQRHSRGRKAHRPRLRPHCDPLVSVFKRPRATRQGIARNACYQCQHRLTR
jgi:hypothetical protein